MVVRTNILNDSTAASNFIAGTLKLKASGRYDNYVRLHLSAQSFFAGKGVGRVNAVHMCAAFLPWHRAMLHSFERDLQIMLGNDQFALPYWDWSADEATLADPTTSALWSAACVGGNGTPISSGPFAGWSTINAQGAVSTAGISRNLGVRSQLPSYASIAEILPRVPYDVPPYNDASPIGFRNALEGFASTASSQMHNAVHGWVGGLMGLVQVSPNDPVFYLHHANVDRIWAQWQQRYPQQTYVPVNDGIPSQQLNDVLAGFPFLPNPLAYSPASVQSTTSLNYAYDVFPV